MGAEVLSLRGIRGRFFNQLDALLLGAWADKIAMRFDSDASQETYNWLGMSPALRDWVGGRDAVALRGEGIVIVNRPYEATIDINVDHLRRDQTGQILVRIDELADRAAEHWHSLLTTLIVTPGNAYDGAAYFGVHEEGESTSQTNLLTSTEVGALNVSTANAPTANEMALIVEGVMQHIFGILDDRGEPMNANARDFVIMVPVNMWGALATALSANQLDTGSGGTRDNLLKSLAGFTFTPVPNPRLSADTIIYVFRGDAIGSRSLIMQDELIEVDIDEGQRFTNNRLLYGVKALRNVGTGYWQQAMKCTLS